jgi:hypothetical protein
LVNACQLSITQPITGDRGDVPVHSQEGNELTLANVCQLSTIQPIIGGRGDVPVHRKVRSEGHSFTRLDANDVING